jgi:NlpC/P60 family putative phage cell wall peptidase
VTDLRAAIVECALSWVGTPYHHRARIKGVGVDCAQLLIGVYAEAGLIEPFDTGDYPQDWACHRDDERFVAWVERFATRTERTRPGDVLVYRYFRCFSHGAIVIDEELMVHSFIGRGVEVVERAEFTNRAHLAFTLLGESDVRQ